MTASSRTIAPSPSATTVEVRHQVAPAEWDEQIRTLGGPLFHTSVWSEYRSLQAAHPLFLRWIDASSGAVVGMAVGAQHPLPTARIARFASYVLIESPPAARHDGMDFLTPLRRWARLHGGPVSEIQLGSLDSRSRWAPTDPARPVRHYEFLFTPRDPDRVLGAMSRGTRSHVRRAQRLGVQARAASGTEDLLVFAQLGEATKRRLGETKGLPPSVQGPEGRARALELLVRRGAGRLYLAYVADRAVAGCFFGIWDRSAYYLQNGADADAHRYDAVHLLLHHAITDFMAEGFTRVNLGSVPAEGRDESSIDHGLYNFKVRLGTEPVACVGGSLVLRPARARALVLARQQRDRLRWIRRHLPPGTTAGRHRLREA